MDAALVLCVRGSARAQWIPVPTTRRGSLQCATLSSSKSAWAVNALKGARKDRETCGAHLVLRAFESDVRARVASLSPPDVSQPAAKKQRLLESDTEAESASDAEDDSQQSSASSPLDKKTAHFQKVDKVGFTKIDLNGFEINVGFHKGPGVQVPATQETVSGLLKFLDQHYDTFLAAGRDLMGKRLAARQDGPQEILKQVPPRECREPCTELASDTDTNKIRFCFRRVAYRLFYFDGSGMRSISKGFEVPRADPMGNILSDADYANVKAFMKGKARQAWNKLDKSSAPRFPADQTSSDATSAA